MNNSSSELTLHDRPIVFWLFGASMLAGAVYSFTRAPAQWLLISILALFGLGLLMMPSVSVSADRITRTLTISRHSLIRKSQQKIAFREITGISVSYQLDREDRSRTYRVEISLHNGEIVPLRSAYTSGHKRKDEQAQQLRAIVGIGEGGAGTLPQAFDAANLQRQLQQQQEEITGEQGIENITRGVRWSFETLAFSSMPLSHWRSPDFHLQDSFLFLAQKTPEQDLLPNWLQSATNLLFKQSMLVYGFGEGDSPDIATATPIELPERLKPYFLAYGDEPDRAEQLLNTWVISPLVEWAHKYPLTQKNVGSQIVLHIGPKGLSLRTVGLANPDYLDELTALGVELVRALGGGKPS
ncbi:MAG: hypothetical protein HN413_01350 [Chloroflexi bacterium]|jgi:hypothetical protein|nr:hypothetical protein [Chloroflexota bacterium]